MGWSEKDRRLYRLACLTRDPYLSTVMKVTASGLAGKIAPKIQDAFKSRERELVKSLHPWFLRQAAEIAYPMFLDQIPELTRLAVDLVSTEFGAMNVNDLLAFLNDHIKAKAEL